MADLFAPIHPVSATDEVQDQVIKLITEGRLADQDRLPAERDLAITLGLSRATVREALRGLVDRGVLESRPGAGWFVRRRSDALAHNIALHFRLEEVSLPQMAEVRFLLEPHIAELAAARRDAEDLSRLRTCLDEMAATKDPAQFVRSDTAFHEALAESVKNPFFVFALKPILVVLADSRAEAARRRNAMSRLLRDHEGIFEAVAARDIEAAGEKMKWHLHGFLSSTTSP